MSALNAVLKQQNQLLSAQVEDLATQVDNLKTNFAAALSKLQEHEPDYVKQFLVQDTASAMEPVEAPQEEAAEAPRKRGK